MVVARPHASGPGTLAPLPRSTSSIALGVLTELGATTSTPDTPEARARIVGPLPARPLELTDMSGSRGDNVIIERVEVPAWQRDLLLDGAHDAELLILPVEVRDGRGVYRDADLPAVKKLRAAGVNADWAPTPRPNGPSGPSTAPISRPRSACSSCRPSANTAWSRLPGTCRCARGRFLGIDRQVPRPRRSPFNLDHFVRDGDRLEIEGLRITGSDSEQLGEVVLSVLRGDPPPG
jgi:hypothetical protein